MVRARVAAIVRPETVVGRRATGDLLPDLAGELVTARLAASANIWTAPLQATYWWHGKVQMAIETRMHLLTRTDLLDRLVAFVRDRHPYDVPNVTAIPIVAGNADSSAR